ncbi:glycerophosphodiester phosphodiesterase [Allorhodopirellula solitaria]|uniref:Putative glycerophosphoryl diester phosphodiesterase 1 n=1 Tax=Allorhodopirellula solitaria TaxID=2527987 RepID=A0A5C5XQ49_9BACT|nr:glycerophosphodiester phosphodiesterase [Allorhodopirellula solitaria]TWT64768.1 putative glycerophosphoryl diester phosphodiesterase 1 [Allorhodopirellula solitaria]
MSQSSFKRKKISRVRFVAWGATVCSLAFLSPELLGAEPTNTATRSSAKQPLIVAHRGASHDAPENTLAAFNLAWKQNADVIEGDFYLTADDQIVCLHDKTTSRTAPNQPSYTPADATLEQLRTLDVGAWKGAQFAGEKIPTLDEVLKTIPAGKKIFVEIKCGPEILPVLKEQLASSDLRPDQIVLICFNTEVVTQARKTMDQYQTNWLTSYRRDSKTQSLTPTTSTIVDTLRKTSASGLGTRDEMDAIDGEMVRAVHEMGCGIHAWTVDNPSVAKTLHQLGFDSITTNRPAEIRAAIGTTKTQ